jgi:hypothetical protein
MKSEHLEMKYTHKLHAIHVYSFGKGNTWMPTVCMPH